MGSVDTDHVIFDGHNVDFDNYETVSVDIQNSPVENVTDYNEKMVVVPWGSNCCRYGDN